MNTLLLWPLVVFHFTFPGTEVLELLESGKLVFSENPTEVPAGLRQQISAGQGSNFVLQDEWSASKGASTDIDARVLIFYAYEPGSRNCLLYYQDHANTADYTLVYGKFRKSSGDYSLAAVRFSAADTQGDKSVSGLMQRIEEQKYVEYNFKNSF